MKTTTELYLRELKNHDLITKEDEKRFGKAILDSKKSLILEFMQVPAIVQKLHEDINTILNNKRTDLLIKPASHATNKKRADKSHKDLGDILIILERYGDELGALSTRKKNFLYKKVDEAFKHIDFLKFKTPYLEELGLIIFSGTPESLGISKKFYNELSRNVGRHFTTIQEARDKLTKANLRLAVSNAKKYLNQGLSMPDLIQEANIGLMTSTDKFDHRKNLKFSTYATWWIRLFITKAINEKTRTIRLPSNILELRTKIFNTMSDYKQKNMANPPISWIAKETGIPKKKVKLFLDSHKDMLSLDVPVGDETRGSSLLGDLIEDVDAVNPEGFSAQNSLNKLLEDMFSKHLNEIQSEVLRLRFGLGEDIDRGFQYTLEDIGQKFNLTRERIRQIEAQSLKKLRAEPEFAKVRYCL